MGKTKRGKGTKIELLVDGRGLPLSSFITSASHAEVNTVETLLEGAPKTPYLKFGDTVRVEMKDAGGRSIFGAIEQEVRRYEP